MKKVLVILAVCVVVLSGCIDLAGAKGYLKDDSEKTITDVYQVPKDIHVGDTIHVWEDNKAILYFIGDSTRKDVREFIITSK